MLRFGKRSWRPSHKVRARRRKLLMWKVGGVGVALLLVVSGLAFASHHTAITVQEILISGNQTILDTELRDVVSKRLGGRYGFLFARSNILLYPKDALVASVLNIYPRIKEAHVDTKNLKTIELSVVEREPFALWCGESETRPEVPCYFLDKEGFIFTEAPSFTDPLFFVYYGAVGGRPLGSQYLTIEAFTEITQFISLFEALEFEPVAFVSQENTDAAVVLNSGARIYFDRADDLREVFERLESVFSAETFTPDTRFEYIDLRFGNKVYYTLE